MIKTLISKKIDIVLCFILATITGVLFYYPHYKSKQYISEDKILSNHFIYSPLVYAYIPGSPVASEIKYAAISRKIMDGNWNLGDANIYEKRKSLNPAPKLPYIISGLVARLLGSVASFFILSDFVFPFLSVISCYIFLRTFIENRFISLWGSIVLLSMYSIFQLVKILLFNFEDVSSHLNPCADKYPSYQLIFPFTFLFYFSCYQLLRKNNSFYCVITGMLAGISAYIYLYSFMTFSLQLVFLMLFTYFRSKKDSLKFLISIAIALLIGIFYIKNTLAFMSDHNHIFKLMTTMLTKNTNFSMSRLGVKFLLCSAVLLYLARKVRSVGEKVVFIFSIGIPTFLLIILSTIVLFVPQTLHFNTFEMRNMLFITILLVISVLIDKEYIKEIFKKGFFTVNNNIVAGKKYFINVAIVIVFVLHSCQILASEFYWQSKQSSLYGHLFTIHRDVMDAYNWLDKHVPKDSVLLSIDSEQIAILPIYTGLYIYIPDMLISVAPVNEVWERIRQGFEFCGVRRETVEKILTDYEGYEPNYELQLQKLKYENDFIKEYQYFHHELKKRTFPLLVFHGQYRFDTKSLSFRYYKKYFGSVIFIV